MRVEILLLDSGSSKPEKGSPYRFCLLTEVAGTHLIPSRES
jgi:hypothetical protein